MIHRTKVQRPERKAKKSYTLSAESVLFLETMRKKRHAASASSVLDEILQALRKQTQRASIDEAVTRYYSSLSAQEETEQSEWGEFAASEFFGKS
jgi:hypothetical protein